MNHDDPIEELLNAARERLGEAAPPKTPPDGYQFTENCPACRGTGRWGRSDRQCFKCQGRGSRSYKTAPGVRQQARVYAANSRTAKQESIAEATAAWKEANPQEWAYLARNKDKNEFLSNLYTLLHQHGDLSEGRVTALRRGMEWEKKGFAQAAAREEAAPTVNLHAIEAAFAKASTKTGNPKLRLGKFYISFAPDTGKWGGSLYVKETGTRAYLGRITLGKFVCAREGQPHEAAILAAIADPSGAAIAHGKLTKQCAVCGITLSNPESVARGIGPICAENMGW